MLSISSSSVFWTWIVQILVILSYGISAVRILDLDTDTKTDHSWSQLNCAFVNEINEFVTVKKNCKEFAYSDIPKDLLEDSSTGFWSSNDCSSQQIHSSNCFIYFNWSATVETKIIPKSVRVKGFIKGQGGILVTITNNSNLYNVDLTWNEVEGNRSWTRFDKVVDLSGGPGFPDDTIISFELKNAAIGSFIFLDGITFETDESITPNSIKKGESETITRNSGSEITSTLARNFSRINAALFEQEISGFDLHKEKAMELSSKNLSIHNFNSRQSTISEQRDLTTSTVQTQVVNSSHTRAKLTSNQSKQFNQGPASGTARILSDHTSQEARKTSPATLSIKLLEHTPNAAAAAINELKVPLNEKNEDASESTAEGGESTDSSVGDESTVSPDGEESTSSPDGDESTNSPDGDESTDAPDGDESANSPDGDESTDAPDGDESTSSPDGEESTSTPEGDDASTPSEGESASESTSETGDLSTEPGEPSESTSPSDESSTTETIPDKQALGSEKPDQLNWRNRIGLYVGLLSIAILILGIIIMIIVYKVKRQRQITLVDEF